MYKIRKAIKEFKDDFILEPNAASSTSRLGSKTSSSRTTSDDVSGYDSSNFNEAVSPIQKRSLFQSLQHNTALVSPNEPLPSIESGLLHQDQSKSLNLTPILGNPISVNRMNEEFSKIALSNSSEKRTILSNDPSVPSIDILPPATSSKQVLFESPQQNPPMDKPLPPDPKGKEFETLLTGQWQESKDAYYHTISKTINGNAVSSMPLMRKFPESLSNSTSFSISEADDGPMESKQSPVTHMSRQFRKSAYDNSVIQTTTPTASKDDDDNDQNTLETKERPDPTPITQPFPLTPNRLLERPNPFFKRENSVPGDLLLDGPPTSSSVQNPSVKSATKTFPDGNPTSKDNNDDDGVEARRVSMNTRLLALVALPTTPTVVSTQVPETVKQTKTPWRPKPFRLLQPIGESSGSVSANSLFALSPDDVLARKMEELGRLRRMESRNQLAQSKASHEVTSQQPSQPNRTTTTPKAELRPHIHQEDSLSDVAGLLEAAYIEQQQALQTQVNKAVAELRDVREENKRLTQVQHDSRLQIDAALNEIKHAHEHSVQIKNQLRDATTSLAALNNEKKGWQDKLDSMQHELNVAERQVRCLYHLTRHKLESRQEAAYGQPKRRGLSASVPASPDVIAVMSALNEEISRTCVLLIGTLRRLKVHSNRHKLQAQKVLGDHLTAMMEDQATTTTSGCNMLLMQVVLEVFMVHWCSSIIQAFYPKQESFANLLVQLSARTAKTSESSAMCGKQIQITQPSTPHTDNVEFHTWVIDIIKELDSFLLVAGVRIKSLRFYDFYDGTLALVRAAYDLRIAMAERDIHGGLEVVIVPPDTPFQEKWMLDADADTRKGDMDQPYVDFVAGTSGIGLQRKVLEKADGFFQSRMNTELKPKVTLAQALNIKIKSSGRLHSQPKRTLYDTSTEIDTSPDTDSSW